MMHELIDREDPHCLYCNGQCNIALQGKLIPHSSLTYDIEILTCQECKERFCIDTIQNEKGETTYMSFSFTCKKYNIIFLYADETFDLYTRKGKHITALPIFEVDFSDKKKLYNKLKIYTLFS
jgi:hypothetical protein